jgi:hypothetical protein
MGRGQARRPRADDRLQRPHIIDLLDVFVDDIQTVCPDFSGSPPPLHFNCRILRRNSPRLVKRGGLAYVGEDIGAIGKR